MGDYIASHLSPAGRLEQIRKRPNLYGADLLELIAEAWDEGCAAGHYNEMAVCQCAAWYEHECACGNFGNGEKPETNPYKKEA